MAVGDRSEGALFDALGLPQAPAQTTTTTTPTFIEADCGFDHGRDFTRTAMKPRITRVTFQDPDRHFWQIAWNPAWQGDGE